MTMEFLTRELGGAWCAVNQGISSSFKAGFALGNGANINGVPAQLLLALLAIAFLCGSLRGLRRRRLQRSISVRGAPLDFSNSATRVPAFVRKFIDAEQSLQASREAVYAVESSDDTDSSGGKKLDADNKDTNGVLWGLLRNFLRAACLHLAALPRSLLISFSNLATEIRRGSNHLITPKNLVVGDMKILVFCSIGFHFISGANAQDQTDDGKPVDPEAWKTGDNTKAAAMFLLASSIGGVGVVVWILYNRRRTFSLDDIHEGLMRGPAVVRRGDPAFELPPSIEPWSDAE